MNIVITGCTRGIGLCITQSLLKDTNHKVIGIARDQASLSRLSHSFQNKAFVPIAFDMEKYSREKTKLNNQITETFETVDILINNAGILINESFDKTTYESILSEFEVNFFAPALLIADLLPIMGIKNRSHVVNIGSVGGINGSKKFPGISYYSASKASLAVLTECLSEEYKDKNIAFNCLALGAVQTDMLAQAFPGYKAPITPCEMGAYIAQFALTGHHLFNGKILPVSLSTP